MEYILIEKKWKNDAILEFHGDIKLNTVITPLVSETQLTTYSEDVAKLCC